VCSLSRVSENYVTFGIIRVVRGDHSRDRLTNHYIADLKCQSFSRIIFAAGNTLTAPPELNFVVRVEA
jgi:hypothetical protein